MIEVTLSGARPLGATLSNGLMVQCTWCTDVPSILQLEDHLVPLTATTRLHQAHVLEFVAFLLCLMSTAANGPI
jgi:hypothetical protein